MFQTFVNLANPKDFVESTAPYSILQLIFGQLPYKVIKSPDTRKYELCTSIPGMILCIGHLALYIAALAVHQLEMEQVIETKVSYYAIVAQHFMSRAITLSIFAIALLRKDSLRRYVRLLNQLDGIYGEIDRQFICKKIFYTVTAITTAMVTLLIISMIYSHLSAHLVNITKNSDFTVLYTGNMPVIYLVITAINHVIINLIIYWHYVWFNNKLAYIHRNEKDRRY